MKPWNPISVPLATLLTHQPEIVIGAICCRWAVAKELLYCVNRHVGGFAGLYRPRNEFKKSFLSDVSYGRHEPAIPIRTGDF